MHRHEYDKCEEHQRVCNVKRRFSEPEEELQAEDRHRAPPVEQIVLYAGGRDIRERGEVCPRFPHHRVVIVIAVDGHKVIQRKHEQKDCTCDQSRAQQIFAHYFTSLSFRA